MFNRVILVLILMMPFSSFAGRYWTNWEEIRGKGVVGCDQSDAKSKARGRCNARIQKGHNVERVELSGFNREIWRDGWMNRERNCAYATNARCLITSSDSGYGQGTVNSKNETLIINNCTQPVFVSKGYFKHNSWSTAAGVYVTETYRISKGHYKVNPRSSKVISGSYLLIRSKGKTLSRTENGFCYKPSDRFEYKIFDPNNTSQDGRNGCFQKGGKWFGYEDVRKYNKYNVNTCN